MTAQGPTSRAVTAALKAAPPESRDAGAVALIKNYAALIDEAAPAAKYRKPLVLVHDAVALQAERLDDSAARQLIDAYETIRTALSSHSVASDLGPKLLVALTSLGLTVAGRGKELKESPDVPLVPGAAELDELQARRVDRERRTATVDPAT